jgi:hypothetical protein
MIASVFQLLRFLRNLDGDIKGPAAGWNLQLIYVTSITLDPTFAFRIIPKKIK